MTRKTDSMISLEPERYELASAPAYVFDLDRRDFFKLFGAGILLLSVLNDGASSQESGKGEKKSSETQPTAISAWLHIGENGIVTVYTGKVEVGQNIRTSLSQAVAEERRTGCGREERDEAMQRCRRQRLLVAHVFLGYV